MFSIEAGVSDTMQHGTSWAEATIYTDCAVKDSKVKVKDVRFEGGLSLSFIFESTDLKPARLTGELSETPTNFPC